MIRVHCEVLASAFDLDRIVRDKQSLKGAGATRSIALIMVESTLEYYRKLVEIPFAFDYIIIGACFKRSHCRVFVAYSGNDYYGDGYRGFADVPQQFEAVTIRQVHVGEN